jgi:FkbM family methyltransferase
MIKVFIKYLFKTCGYNIAKKNPDFVTYPRNQTNEGILHEILKMKKINLTLDVGANSGDWALTLRHGGYNGKIISFEPLTSEFDSLSRRSSEDSNWDTFNSAIGDKNCVSQINIANNSVSSSLSKILDTHTTAEPDSKFILREDVEVQSLNNFKHDWIDSSVSIFLKLDVQGFEKKVLDGATLMLNKIKVIQIEMSFKQLYSDDLCFDDMKSFLESSGFRLYHIQNGFRSAETKELFQVDAIFINKT